MSVGLQNLAKQALLQSEEVRRKFKLGSRGPICAFDLCEEMGLDVQFIDVSMEGMYVRDDPPAILISVLRPLPRRHFTCAHELGHHLFGHGTSVDGLSDESDGPRKFDPKEFLVNSFAGFLLMPMIAVRKAFASRGWQPDAATPLQLYTVACSFGVGYVTLVNHLAYSLGLLRKPRADAMAKTRLGIIRREAVGRDTPQPLVVADSHYSLQTLDAEVDHLLLLPLGSEAEGRVLEIRADLPSGRLFRAVRPGLAYVRTSGGGWEVLTRVSPREYLGASRNRHEEAV